MPLLLKKIASSAFDRTGAVQRRLERRSRDGEYLILMYHRVLPDGPPPPGLQAGMYVTAETFRAQVRYLKRRFRLISFKELPEVASSGRKSSRDLPCCVLTFDDGWSDFYGQAYPALKEAAVPATVFLPTRFIGTERRFWTDEIAHLFVEREKARGGVAADAAGYPEPAASLLSLSGPLESRIENAIRLLKGCRYREAERAVGQLKEAWGIGSGAKGRVFLDWDEVREMAGSGIVSFGSHTAGHEILTHLEEDEIRGELAESREKLLSEKAADPSCLTFSYPNGDHDPRAERIVAEMGYRLAVTTDMGWNGASASPFLLKRVSIHQDMTSNDSLFGCRIAGFI